MSRLSLRRTVLSAVAALFGSSIAAATERGPRIPSSGQSGGAPAAGPVTVRQFGAVGDGIANDFAAIDAARAAAAANGSEIVFTAGRYRIGTNLAIDANVVVRIAPGARLLPDKGVKLTIHGPLVASPTVVFGGLGRVVLNREINGEVWANWYTGSDIGAQVNAAVLSLSKSGPRADSHGVIRIAPADYNFATTIDLSNTNGVTLMGAGGSADSTGSPGVVLQWTGGPGTGPLVNLSGAIAANVCNFTWAASTPAYNGTFLHTANGTSNVSTLHVHHCAFIGSAKTSQLIALDTVISGVIEQCTFRYAMYHVKCTGASNNTITIRNCYFDQTAASANIGIGFATGWQIVNNVFETTRATAIKLLAECSALSITANWMNDVAERVTVIDLTGFKLNGAMISGNFIAINSKGTGIALSVTPGESRAICVQGNFISGTGTAVHLGASEDVRVTENSIRCTIPITGTSSATAAPTKYCVANNFLDAAPAGTYVNIGIPVNNGPSGVIPLTADASAGLAGGIKGSGIVTITATHAGSGALLGTAMVSLNHSAQTTTKIFDALGNFSGARNNPGTFNVFFDSSGAKAYKLQNLSGNDARVIVNAQSPF